MTAENDYNDRYANRVNDPVVAPESDQTLDDRTAREIAAEVWHAVWNLLDDAWDMDGDTAGRIAQTASDLTELAFIRKGREATR